MEVLISILFWLVPISILLALALPPALKAKSRKVFFFALFIAAFGVLLPLFSYLFSVIYMPWWKGGANYGWINTFHVGKFALLPLLVWGLAALYVLEIRPHQIKTPAWISLGLFLGLSVCIAWLVQGAFTIPRSDRVLLLIPLYLPFWLGWRTIQTIRSSKLGLWPYIYAMLGSIPFWVYSVIWSKNEYNKLPETAPDCFIVTAATQGHPAIVGSFTPPDNQVLHAINQQLLTFWKFEDVWKCNYPKSHKVFRRSYNNWGYRAARLITNPWIADLIYILLKPIEWMVLVLLLISRHRENQG